MSIMFSMDTIKEFQRRAMDVCNRIPIGEGMPYPGLCGTIASIDTFGKYLDFVSAYYIMYNDDDDNDKGLLTIEEYAHRLAPSFEMTADRWFFCYFIATMDAQDIYDICN